MTDGCYAVTPAVDYYDPRLGDGPLIYIVHPQEATVES